MKLLDVLYQRHSLEFDANRRNVDQKMDLFEDCGSGECSMIYEYVRRTPLGKTAGNGQTFQ
jgi:hypothetical protein